MTNSTPIQLTAAANRRQTISLNGIWELCGTPESVGLQDLPHHFDNSVPVPGLLDMAEKPFVSPAAWYRRSFCIEGPIPENAMLKINKAWWGKQVFLNAYSVCRHEPNFTPLYVNLKQYIHGGMNTLLVRLGNYNSQTADAGCVVGADYEKFDYTPGIYDDVSLYFCGNPMIQYIQTAPDVATGTITVQLTLINTGASTITDTPRLRISDPEGIEVSSVLYDPVELSPGQTVKAITTVRLAGFKPWSPESPRLYTATATTAGDEASVRFGMRNFWFDARTGLPMLNGKPYFWRGTNITMYRFFEDPNRKALPWNRQWARKVLESFKRTNMNSIRYCIGFPPELWYDLADEIGFLIQDEYPIWGEVDVNHTGSVPHWKDRAPEVTRTLLPELIDWQNERANHACVVLWDMQNETDTNNTEILIKQLRDSRTDLQDRPFDNGWGRPARDTDTLECHPYLFIDPHMTWNKAQRANRDPAAKTPCFFNYIHSSDLSLLPRNPRITNEYCWFWLNRDHSPTTLTRDLYKNLIPNATAEERRLYHDLAITKLTEFWRSSRTSTGVLYFCGLTYEKTDVGRTCDEFVGDIANPTCTETYVKYMHDAMAPLGICIDDLSDRYAPGKKALDIVMVNDLEDDWRGEVRIVLTVDGKTVSEQALPAGVSGFGRAVYPVSITVPDAIDACGELTASYTQPDGEIITSRRRFTISTDLHDDGQPVSHFDY